MPGLKKPMTAPVSREVRLYLMEGMSKSALADCLADALACIKGGESSDLTVSDLREFIEPRLGVRGDRAPR